MMRESSNVPTFFQTKERRILKKKSSLRVAVMKNSPVMVKSVIPAHAVGGEGPE